MRTGKRNEEYVLVISGRTGTSSTYRMLRCVKYGFGLGWVRFGAGLAEGWEERDAGGAGSIIKIQEAENYLDAHVRSEGRSESGGIYSAGMQEGHNQLGPGRASLRRDEG